MNAERLVFLDVDTQIDFMTPRGALYVPEAETIVPQLRRLKEFALAHDLLVLSTADAHAADDPSFATWPPHCVIGTPGQKRIPETSFPSPRIVANRAESFQPPLPASGQIIVEKIDYDVSSNPNFDALLAALGPSRFVAFGVATDYCLQASSLALRRKGYPVAVVTDAIKGISAGGHEKALQTLVAAGVSLTTTAEVLRASVAQAAAAKVN